MSENEKLKLELRAFYLAGGIRADAMKRWKLTTGQLAGLSTRLKMNWSWPLENRRSGVQPLSAQPRGPRKPSQTGGGTIASINARASRVTGPANLEVAADAPLYETPSPLRRYYGKPTLLSERQKYERGVADENNSAMPEPKGEVTKEDILFLQRHLYEGKPLKI